MIKIPTVLILGAGASWDYGFPVGEGLRNQICREINGGIYPYLEQNWKRSEVQSFGRHLLQSRISVDAFLEDHPEYLDIGKFAIASKLLPCENERSLYRNWLYPEKTQIKGKNHWYDILFGKLIDGADFDNFKDNKLSVITFNYDRSFEHFLFNSFKSSRKKAKENETDCISQVSSIEVVHVYGSLGRLPWQSDSGLLKGVPEVDYSALGDGGDMPPKIATIKLAADSIDLMRDGSGDTPAFSRAKELLQQARRIYILGFGFNMTNLKRLSLLDTYFHTENIQGTAHNLPTQLLTEIKQIKYVESIEDAPPRKNLENRFNLYGQTVYDFLYKNPNGFLD